jgi:hypothetical protein
VLEINNQKYSTKELTLVEDPQPSQLRVSTLTGIVDYITANVDKIEEKLLIQVINPTQVRVLSPLKHDANRNFYIECEAVIPRIEFGYFEDVEKFNIMLQSCFLKNTDRDLILKIVGNIKEENVRNTGDDGISQNVTAKSGINLVQDIKLPNPVTLIPFKTFIEIEQPEIKYVFRMKDGPQAALFEADGGAWKLQTMLNIKKYLANALENKNIEIIS